MSSYVRRAKRPTDHYFPVSNTLARDPDLSPKAKGVALWLLSHRETFRFSIPTIAEAMGTGVDLIKAALRELADLGYLVRTEIREQGRMVGMIYEMDDDPHRVEGDIAQLRAIRGFSADGSATDGSATDGESGGLKKTKSLEDQREEHQQEISLDLPGLEPASKTDVDTSETDAPDVEAAFEEFWAAYPRKVEKQGARRKFAAQVKAGADPAAIVAGAVRYAAEREGQDKAFTKHPTTWLNNGCWEDEAAPARSRVESASQPYKDADHWGAQPQGGTVGPPTLRVAGR